MSEQASISTAHFSRILIDLGRYIQRINLNRIIDALSAEKFLCSETAQKIKGISDEYEKSNIVISIMQGRWKERDFKTFLKIIAAEKPGSKFYGATREFFSGFWQFPGYEQYATCPNGKSVIHSDALWVLEYYFYYYQLYQLGTGWRLCFDRCCEFPLRYWQWLPFTVAWFFKVTCCQLSVLWFLLLHFQVVIWALIRDESP